MSSGSLGSMKQAPCSIYSEELLKEYWEKRPRRFNSLSSSCKSERNLPSQRSAASRASALLANQPWSIQILVSHSIAESGSEVMLTNSDSTLQARLGPGFIMWKS